MWGHNSVIEHLSDIKPGFMPQNDEQNKMK